MTEIWKVKKRSFKNIIDQLLFNRGVKLDHDSKQKYFQPSFNDDLSDPFVIKSMSKAVDRIHSAVINREKIGIFADYDADGIPGAALLYKTLVQLGVKPLVYIPNRDRGYGMNISGLQDLIKRGCTLIITIDLGIKNFEEAKLCKKNKIDLIITDHHLPDDKLPEALAIINPKMEKRRSSLDDLCGCAVVYKLITALKKYFKKQISESFLKWNLDLVAISTISDMVPLTGENRVLAKYGLLVLNKTKNLGLAELIKVSEINNKIDAYSAGFKIGPRLNAPGRVDNATKSFELLISNNKDEAKALALSLNRKNQLRQSQMEKIQKQVEAQIISRGWHKNKIIIAQGEWSRGVLGPTASRIAEIFNRPTIIFSKDDNIYTGSARSVNDIDLMSIIESSRSYIKKYGGHRGAAGVTVDHKNYEHFSNCIINYANKNLTNKDLDRVVEIDLIIEPKEINISLIRNIDKFEPFGLGNERPNFLLQGVNFSNTRLVGKNNQHLTFVVEKTGRRFRGVFFNYKKEDPEKLKKGMYDVVVNLKINQWRNEQRIDLMVNHIRSSIV